MSLGAHCQANTRFRFPRVSGDEPVRGFLAVDVSGFSPRERG